MKTLIAALALTIGFAAAALPTSAAYVAPDAPWTEKALAGNGY